MESIKSKDLESINKKRIFKTSLALTLIVFAFTMSSPSSFFQFVKPVEAAGTLTNIAIVPSNNLVNTRGIYEIIFKTATTGTIKTIEINFPHGFDIHAATRVIERSGIGSGPMSVSGQTLIYTVDSPVSVNAGTAIRLEVGKIDNSDTPNNSAEVTITTKNTGGNTIDGPTSSSSFVIKAIERLDIDPDFMIRKTLLDDTAGHAQGWDPNGVTTDFTISDNSIEVEEEAVDQTMITLMLRNSHDTNSICMVNHTQEDSFLMNCNTPPANNAQLHYEIHRLAANRVTSASSASLSSLYESLRAHDGTASEFP